MRKITGLTAALAFLVLAHAGTALADPFKVNSGKILDVVAIQEVKSEGTRALAMRFGTKTSLSDLFGLRAEADELWEHLVVNVEKGGYRRAVIRAQAAGGPRDGKTVEFVYLKRGKEWRTLEKGLGRGERLTGDFVRARFAVYSGKDRFHHSPNLLLLYTSPDWTISYTYPKETGVGPIDYDRIGFMDVVRQTLNASSRNKERVNLVRVKVSQSGKTAATVFKLSGDVVINGVTFIMSGHFYDTVKLRQGAIVSVRSRMVIDSIEMSRAH